MRRAGDTAADRGADRAAAARRQILRPVWMVLGVTALALGALGVVLPVLPTTPFVLLAAFAFSQSAPRLAAALETHRVFGPIIADWRANGAIAPRYKAMAIAMMAAALAASLAAGLSPLVLAIQGLCMTAAASFILTRPNGAP